MIMTKEDIKKTIENAEFKKDQSSKFDYLEFSDSLLIWDDHSVYSVHGVRSVKCPEKIALSIVKLVPFQIKFLDTLSDLPDDVDNMQTMWNSDFKKKYDDVYKAMDEYKSIKL